MSNRATSGQPITSEKKAMCFLMSPAMKARWWMPVGCCAMLASPGRGTSMKIVREPYGYSYAEKSRLKETYGGPEGQVFVECMRIRPDTGESKTVILFSHPIGGGSFP